MCHHANILDDFQSGDSVCTDCGLVLERILGRADGGGERWRKREGEMNESPQSPHFWWTERQEEEKNVHSLQKIREEFRSCLEQFNLDNEYVLERVLDNYQKIYGGREVKPGFRKTQNRHKIAAAFSIYNILVRERAPRPVQYIADLFNLESCRSLLNLTAALKITKSEQKRIPRRYYELQDTSPEDYIDVLCAHLTIPFDVASTARERAESVKWELYGRHPTVIAAAVLQEEVSTLDYPGLNKKICFELNCRQKSVAAARKKISFKKKREEAK